ncbi:MarR family winged helix-turn-helix transcriptional regulator [Streptomyces sp. NPDC002680]|uniref:MarR family winged helix-turn-helix transcriptional regulator n=1 Tax=Streptomyces sp. NPDC002680 TaxID=3364659 RepID=UPI0036C207B9
MSTEHWNARESQAWRGLLDAQRLVREHVERDLARETDLSPQDYTVLVALTEAPEGRMRPTDLAAAISWEKSRLSNHAMRMEKRGLVSREGYRGDGRGSVVAVTDAGRAAIRSAAPLHRAHVRKYFIDALTAEQQEALIDISASLIRHVTTAGRAEGAADG